MFGPLLFVIYIDEIVKNLKNVPFFLYAGDLDITVTGKTPDDVHMLLTADFNAIGIWCSLNRSTVKSDKTKVLWCYSDKRPIDVRMFEYILNDNVLKVVFSIIWV